MTARSSTSLMPVGTVIIIDEGYGYRPEGWTSATEITPTASRPGNVTTTYVTADESWWGSHTQKGFNISKTNGGSLVVENTLTNNGIVAVSGTSTINVAKLSGKQIRFYDAELVGDSVIGGNIFAYDSFTLTGTL